MNKSNLIILTALSLIISITAVIPVYAAEENFQASSLTAQDVNCKKCHTDTPHVIHAPKPVDCTACHGNKLNVAIPQCIKCHSGPIHKVHEKKVNSQTCSYCHKTIENVHNNLISGAVCSHCHNDLIEVHGAEKSCEKCHRSPPNIVKPTISSGMTVVCQTCHQQENVAAVHGEAADKEGCYNCHKGTSNITGSDVPHKIHESKVECNACHQKNKQVIIPQCTNCHNIDELHDYGKIGKLNPQTGLKCSICHKEESKSGADATTPKPAQTQISAPTPSAPEETAVETPLQAGETEAAESPGFGAVMAAALLVTAYFVKRRGMQK